MKELWKELGLPEINLPKLPKWDSEKHKIQSPTLKHLSKIDLHCLSTSVIKYIALVCMLVDNIGLAFFPGEALFRIIGRLAFPLFTFAFVEGFYQTHSKLRYLASICIFAAISEVPYDLLNFGMPFYFGEQNPLFIAAFGFLSLLLYEKCSKLGKASRVIFAMVPGLISVYFTGFWGIYIMGLIWIFAAFHKYSTVFKAFFSGLWTFLFGAGWLQFFGIYAAVPILLYNGKRGGAWKWFFYGFYPLHMLLIYFVAKIIGTL